MAKLLFLRDAGPTEVGGFGVSAVGDLLLVEDVQLVQQRCTSVSVQFDDHAVADYFDEQVDRGWKPERFGRVWVHSHPGHSPFPSATDEATFDRCFGGASWAVMLIVARGGQTYARLRHNTGPGGQWLLPVEVDFGPAFPVADHAAWKQEYERCVTARPLATVAPSLASLGRAAGPLPWDSTRPADSWSDFVLDSDLGEPTHEQLVKPF